MRLREVQSILTKNLGSLAFNSQILSNYSPPQFQVTEVLKANRALNEIYETGLFRDVIDNLRVTSFFNNPNDEITINAQENANISNLINQIKLTGNTFLSALNSTLHSDNITEEYICIKITKINRLDDITEVCEKLKKVVDLPLAEYSEGGEARIVNFDSGSFWIDILLPTSASVILISSIAWAGAVIFKKYQEAFAFKEYASGLELQKEYLEALTAAAKTKIDLDIEAEAKLIQNEFYKSNDNDQLGRLKLSIKEYSELIQKGVQIHPSLVAPEKVENLFPNYSNLGLIESKMKYLPESFPTSPNSEDIQGG